jgi:hypothetical protein
VRECFQACDELAPLVLSADDHGAVEFVLGRDGPGARYERQWTDERGCAVGQEGDDVLDELGRKVLDGGHVEWKWSGIAGTRIME